MHLRKKHVHIYKSAHKNGNLFYFKSVVLFCVPLQIHVTFNPAGSYAVDGLKPDTLYHFSLAARSEVGLGVYTQPIEARTAQSSKSDLHCLSCVFLSPQCPLTSDFMK